MYLKIVYMKQSDVVVASGSAEKLFWKFQKILRKNPLFVPKILDCSKDLEKRLNSSLCLPFPVVHFVCYFDTRKKVVLFSHFWSNFSLVSLGSKMDQPHIK